MVYRNHTICLPPVRETSYLIVFKLLSLTDCGRLGKWRECTKIGKLPHIKESCIRTEAEIIVFYIDEEWISRQIRRRLEFRSQCVGGSRPHVIAFAIEERVKRSLRLPGPGKKKPDFIQTNDVPRHLTL